MTPTATENCGAVAVSGAPASGAGRPNRVLTPMMRSADSRAPTIRLPPPVRTARRMARRAAPDCGNAASVSSRISSKRGAIHREFGARVTGNLIFVAELREVDQAVFIAGAGQDRPIERFQPLRLIDRRAEDLGDIARDMIAADRDAAAGEHGEIGRAHV